ncbi:hypothetical protein ACHIPZ_06310 [Antrihabitans sp. NCIMB 15449]|uniref:Condensation domain-containing protein n=1 Tax=Antrihabitans spumae TaxID=3373370 RepID=A0ABW7JIZ6_9NOCA
MGRLSVVDEMFLRSHRGFGTPIAMQGLWRSSEALEVELLTSIHSALARGPLGRRIVRPRTPGARPRWRRDVGAYPLSIGAAPIPAAGLLDWADAAGENLDPTDGPGWRLSAARLDDGGTVLSLVCSHALADARGLVLAVDRALAGESDYVVPQPGSDWADARSQWSIVARGTARALGKLVTQREVRAELARPPRLSRSESVATVRTAIVTVDEREWDQAATSFGGSANSLFIAVVTDVLRSAGYTEPSIGVALPIDVRADTGIDNAMSMTDIDVVASDSPATIVAKCRTAYLAPMTSPAGFPEELLGVLPDRLAHRLAEGAGERDVLCSNIGTIADRIADLGGHRSTGIATRALHPGLTVAQLNRLRTRLSGYLCRSGEEYTLALVALDPRLFGSNSALLELALERIARYGVTARAW